MSGPLVRVVIPAFNEESNIVSVINEIKRKNIPIIIIDDGSVDSTYDKVSKENVSVLLRNTKNLGKGASLRKAFDYIISNDLECDAVIIMDADAQHLPEEIDSFVDKLHSGSSFVIGNRLNKPKNMPLTRIITNKAMSFMISKKCRQPIPDSQCGFKALRKDVLQKISLKTSNYEIDTELLIQASEAGIKIDSVPIKSIYRHQVSSINPFIDSFRFLRYLLTLR